jgi:putative oxidoreductase
MLGALRPAARLLTGTTYAVLGYGVVREPGPGAEEAAALIAAIRKKVPLPAPDEQLVQVNGAIQAVCGALLALGLAPRLCAVVLAGSMIPTTLAVHRFWTVEDPEVRKQQQIQFHKNMAMIGGLLFAALDQPQAGS